MGSSAAEQSVPRIARRRAEGGWRAAVLDERGSRHAFRLRASEEGSGSQAPASASGANNAHEGADTLFVCERRRRRRMVERDPRGAGRSNRSERSNQTVS
jgi:hypothetical protein